jgi:hypothetical protein
VVICEQVRDGVVGQPAATLTALALVAAGVLVLAGRHPASPRLRVGYGLLVVAAGVGSVIQHGPHPPWQAYAHDLPLAAVLGFVAADAAADLAGRRGRAYRWLRPASSAGAAAALAPLVAVGPAAATVAQAGLAAVAVGLSLWRARVRPGLRRTLLTALAVLAAGALAGTLGDRTGLCRPDSLLQGHAVWHLLAAVALWRLAPAVGSVAAPAAGRRLTGSPFQPDRVRVHR